MEKAINFRIDGDLYKKIKIKTVVNDITIKQYILDLIEKDLESYNMPELSTLSAYNGE